MTAMVATQPELLMIIVGFQIPAPRIMTDDLRHLSISSEYAGSRKINMGNDVGLPISHIGHNSFISNS